MNQKVRMLAWLRYECAALAENLKKFLASAGWFKAPSGRNQPSAFSLFFFLKLLRQRRLGLLVYMRRMADIQQGWNGHTARCIAGKRVIRSVYLKQMRERLGNLHAWGGDITLSCTVEGWIQSSWEVWRRFSYNKAEVSHWGVSVWF